MSRNLHGRGCIHTRVDEVANGGPTEIVGDKALVLIPRLTCLFSESTLNTCFYPLTPEILRLECCAVASGFLLEHGRELIREGDNQRLAILDDTGRQAYGLLNSKAFCISSLQALGLTLDNYVRNMYYSSDKKSNDDDCPSHP
jgi:hypothetical protein